jgi:hypothetical protein
VYYFDGLCAFFYTKLHGSWESLFCYDSLIIC